MSQVIIQMTTRHLTGIPESCVAHDNNHTKVGQYSAFSTYTVKRCLRICISSGIDSARCTDIHNNQTDCTIFRRWEVGREVAGSGRNLTTRSLPRKSNVGRPLSTVCWATNQMHLSKLPCVEKIDCSDSILAMRKGEEGRGEDRKSAVSLC